MSGSAIALLFGLGVMAFCFVGWAVETNKFWRLEQRIKTWLRGRRLGREHARKYRMLMQHVSRTPGCSCGLCSDFWGPRYKRTELEALMEETTAVFKGIQAAPSVYERIQGNRRPA